MQSSAVDEKREKFDFQPVVSEDEIHGVGAHEGGGLENGAQDRNMASGSARYLRYILFAVFVRPLTESASLKHMVANILQGLLILYFISSSSLPTPNLPSTPGSGTKWSGHEKQSDQKGTDSVSSATYGEAKASQLLTTPKPDIELPPATASGERMNATFVTLARNSDLWEISRSIRQVEDRFNRQYNYDWVFLNDKPFDETFKKVTASLVSGKTHYGQIPEEHWSFPSFIDQDKAKKVREDMAQRKIIYGDSISYRHMCRFESGFFFRHELMNNFEYYWRVEPSIELFCDIQYDPFKFMKDNGKKYSFVLSLYEYVETIPTLWDSVISFMKKHPEHIAEDNSMGFLSDDDGKTYNHCHFVSWSLLFPHGY
jgi:alpha 1,2-mannosyltransferase